MNADRGFFLTLTVLVVVVVLPFAAIAGILYLLFSAIGRVFRPVCVYLEDLLEDV